ncbi:hypothetical protein GCM10009765_61740 [Fodinicola feengrottensis]|uniref:Uncharacterized protein n=2 Tax=Fodinicola feengrottensis TaxID=435914 RepID=A0ABN2IFN6_9ACTN
MKLFVRVAGVAALVAGSLTVAAAPAAADCQYPYYCSSAVRDTTLYATSNPNGQVFDHIQQGWHVEVTIDSCQNNMVWGDVIELNRAAGWMKNDDLTFSPCNLKA